MKEQVLKTITEADLSDNLEEKVLISEASHSEAMRYMRDILKFSKDDVVTVKFVKKNGETREMNVHFDEDFVKRAIRNFHTPTILRIKKTNKERDNMVVCEMLPGGTYQFRTIPLRKVISVKTGEVTVDELEKMHPQV